MNPFFCHLGAWSLRSPNWAIRARECLWQRRMSVSVEIGYHEAISFAAGVVERESSRVFWEINVVSDCSSNTAKTSTASLSQPRCSQTGTIIELTIPSHSVLVPLLSTFGTTDLTDSLPFSRRNEFRGLPKSFGLQGSFRSASTLRWLRLIGEHTMSASTTTYRTNSENGRNTSFSFFHL